MSTDVLGYLQTKPITLKRAGANEIHTHCWYCGEDPGSRGRLYINCDPAAEVAGLHMCLAGDTRVITAEGTKPIGELVGTTPTLLTTGGYWVKAPIFSFGVQQTFALTLRRDQRTKVIRATGDHRWFRRVKLHGGARRDEVLTRDLQPGDLLSSVRPQSRILKVRLSPFGIARGFVYGDGTVSHKGSTACLYGDKDAALRRFFTGCGEAAYENPNGKKFVRISDLPRYFKTELPDLTESASYLYGWLAGYFAADGTVGPQGAVSLFSARQENLQFVRDLCTVLGIVTHGIRGYDHAGIGGKTARLYRLSIAAATLTEEFFLVEEHRRRFVSIGAERLRLHWVVEKVEEAAEEEEVFCAVVPGTEAFALEDNILTGNCHLCGAKGSLASIKRHFGDFSQEQEKVDDGFVRSQILEEATQYLFESLTDNIEAVRWLRNRGFELETVEKFRLGFDDGTLFAHLRACGYTAAAIQETGLVHDRASGTMTDFLTGHLTIPYQVAGNVVYVRGRNLAGGDRKYLTPSGQKARLFNADVTWGAEEILCAEGELDCMLLSQLGYCAVGVPGAASWQPGWDGYFAQAKRVYLLFDGDDAGRKGADKVQGALGPKARPVAMPANTDVTDYLVSQGHTPAELEALIRRSSGSLLVSVPEAIAEYRSLQGMRGLQFGIPKLDLMIEPGLLGSQLMVILAKSGTGKTLILLNLFQRVCMLQPDAKVLFVSLEQTRGDWWERARRIYRFYFPNSTEADAEAFWSPRLRMVDQNRLTEAHLLQVLDDYEYEMGEKPSLVAVDYLGYWAQSFRGDRYERTSDAVLSMKAIAKDRRIPFLVPHQVNRMSMAGSEPSVDMARDSVTGDTRILLSDGSFTPIADLVGTLPTVVTATPGYRLESRPTVRVWEKGKREVFRVTTESGRTFKATPEHPMLTADREWIPVSGLSVGDRIGLPDSVPVFGTERIPHAQLVGHLIADGGLTTSPISYTEGDREIREQVVGLATAAGVAPLYRKGSEVEVFLSNRGYQSHNPATELMRGLGLFGVKSPDRFLPAQVFRACQDDVAGVLRGLIASDGSVTDRGICFSSASERLARDVQHLLARFGIRSYLTHEQYAKGGYKEGWCWRVAIRQYDSILMFARKIGSVGHKQRQLDELIATPRRHARRVDLYPSSLWAEVHEVRRANGLGWAALSRTGDPKNTVVGNAGQITRDTLRWVAEQVGAKRLHDLATSPLIFERIVSIEPAGEESVYDMTVVGTHNFVGDFVYSNSGVIMETADFVITMWSPDAMPGRDFQERTGELFWKLGKSRHGGVGLRIELAFAPISLAIVPAEDTKMAQWARDELVYQSEFRSTFEEAILRHQAGLGVGQPDFAVVRRRLAHLRDAEAAKRQQVMP